ncbi:MAG TPA: formate dehydrogenase accessory sulfurtransferase FdhD [Methylophilaceae bacterium]|nr:formate dehydrogenase accessory sulfurtransferase FdhD [Methylophilaceae bacterium]
MKVSEDILAAQDTFGHYPVLKWEQGNLRQLADCVAEEVPVAMVYNGVSHAVMLATPQDLEDFAIGFSLTEGIAENAADVYGIETVPQPKGIELHIELAAERFHMLKERRRSMSGRTGCGLCGSESLEQAMRIPADVVDVGLQVKSDAMHRALIQIRSKQQLQGLTGATHACAWVSANGEVEQVREDVGRHNALDKLIGALTRGQINNAGFVLTTSRASYEMVQKVAVVGIPMLAAVSAPTGLAIRIARKCGVTLVGFAREAQHVIYSRPERILHEE